MPTGLSRKTISPGHGSETNIFKDGIKEIILFPILENS